MTVNPKTRRNLYERKIEKDNKRLAELEALKAAALDRGDGIAVAELASSITYLTAQRDGRIERMNGGGE